MSDSTTAMLIRDSVPKRVSLPLDRPVKANPTTSSTGTTQPASVQGTVLRPSRPGRARERITTGAVRLKTDTAAVTPQAILARARAASNAGGSEVSVVTSWMGGNDRACERRW